MRKNTFSNKNTMVIYIVGTLLIIALFTLTFFKLYDIHLSEQLQAFIEQQKLFLNLSKNDLSDKIDNVLHTPLVRFKMYQSKKMQKPYPINFFSIPEIQGITVLDAEGQMVKDVVEENEWTLKRFNVERHVASVKRLFAENRQTVLAAEEYYVAPITQVDERLYLIVFYPIKDDDRMMYYCVITDIQRIISDIISPVKLGAYGSAMALDNFGTALFDIETDIIGESVFDLHQAYPEVLDLDREMLGKDDGNRSYEFLIRSKNELHRKYISWDSVKMGDQKIVLAISTPETDILGEIQKYQGIFSILVISIILVEILFGILIYRLHNRNLTKNANELYNNYLQQSQALIESEKKAVEANRAKSEFLSNMSHELKTPLNAILGFSELLIETEEKPETKAYLQLVKEAGDNLLLIVTDILNFSKIEAGKYTLDITQTQIKQLLEQSVNMFQKPLMDKGLRFNLIVDQAIPNVILVDDLSLSQVINNLLSNAVKFTEKGSVTLQAVLISKSGSRAKIEFSVIDTGIGIDPEMKTHIFDSFTQADSSIRRKFGGTGLGLSITDKILKMMNTSLKVDSEINKGSCFSFILDTEFITDDSNE